MSIPTGAMNYDRKRNRKRFAHENLLVCQKSMTWANLFY